MAFRQLYAYAPAAAEVNGDAAIGLPTAAAAAEKSTEVTSSGLPTVCGRVPDLPFNPAMMRLCTKLDLAMRDSGEHDCNLVAALDEAITISEGADGDGVDVEEAVRLIGKGLGITPADMARVSVDCDMQGYIPHWNVRVQPLNGNGIAASRGIWGYMRGLDGMTVRMVIMLTGAFDGMYRNKLVRAERFARGVKPHDV
jgi:hypothetical protein